MRLASLMERVKAFIIDMFMINMPICYLATYVYAGGAKEFRSNDLVIFASSFLYLAIIMALLFFKGQTLGYKAQNLFLVDVVAKARPKGPRGAFRVAFRLLVFVFSFAFLFGIIFPFLRRDRLCLHDLASSTYVLKKD